MLLSLRLVSCEMQSLDLARHACEPGLVHFTRFTLAVGGWDFRKIALSSDVSTDLTLCQNGYGSDPSLVRS